MPIGSFSLANKAAKFPHCHVLQNIKKIAIFFVLLKLKHLTTVFDLFFFFFPERPSGEEAAQEARQRPLRQPGGAVQEEAAELRRQKRTHEKKQVV